MRYRQTGAQPDAEDGLDRNSDRIPSWLKLCPADRIISDDAHQPRKKSDAGQNPGVARGVSRCQTCGDVSAGDREERATGGGQQCVQLAELAFVPGALALGLHVVMHRVEGDRDLHPTGNRLQRDHGRHLVGRSARYEVGVRLVGQPGGRRDVGAASRCKPRADVIAFSIAGVLPVV